MPSFDGGRFRLRGTCIKSIKLSGRAEIAGTRSDNSSVVAVVFRKLVVLVILICFSLIFSFLLQAEG